MNRRFPKYISPVILAIAGLGLLAATRAYTDIDSDTEPTPHPPLTLEQRIERAQYWANKRGLQFGVPEGAYRAALSQAASLGSPAPSSDFTWKPIGPQPMLNNYPNFGGFFTGPPMNTSAGRFSAIAADPTTQNLIFGGAAGGGIWRSTDGGLTFTQVFDSAPTQAIGAITVDNNGFVWVGTGEGVQSDSYYGQGIFKSTDHGNTWTQISGGAGSPFVHSSFRRIAVDANSPPHIFAAVTYASSGGRADPLWQASDPDSDGLWRSTDGGTTWVQVGNSTLTGGRATFNSCFLLKNTAPCPGMDVVIDPSNSNRVFAAIQYVNVFGSTDGGSTWAEANFPGISTGTINQTGRQALAVTSSGSGAQATVYAAVGDKNGSYLRGFFQSTNSGTSWSAQSIPSVVLGTGLNVVTLDGNGSGTNPYGQSSYDLTVSVVPASPSTVFFGGVGPYVSTNGGASWSFIAGSSSNTTVQETHSDEQASAVDPFNSNKIYVGNDGGFYIYNLSSGDWTSLSNNNNQNSTISSGQIQGIGPHPTDSTRLLAGFQDNGTQLWTGTLGWNTVETGDGGFALFDTGDPTFAYHTYATTGSGPSPARSTDGGLTWNDTLPGNSLAAVTGSDTFNFYPPLASDPATAHRVVIGGHFIYVSTNGMTTWQVQSNTNLTGSCGQTNPNCALQDLEFVPNSNNAWALSIQSGSIGFAVSNTTQANLNTGAVWNNVTANLPFSSSQTQATGITVDPNAGRSNVAYLSISGFTASTGIGHIFRTTDFGATWTRDDGNGGAAPLPDVPTLRLLVDSTDTTGNTLLAGTDIGMFRSTDGGATWASFNQSVIPAVPAFDVEQNKSGTVFVGTHGRGAYELSAVAPTPTPTSTASGTPTSTATSSATPTATSSSTPTATATPTPSVTPTATITPTPTSTATVGPTASATPTVTVTPTTTPTPTPGASATSSPTNVSGAPGSTVTSGTVTLSNNTAASESVDSVTISIGHPGLFSSMTLSGGGQSATVTQLSSSTTFIFASPITIPAGGSVTFTLTATISASAMADHVPVMMAGMGLVGIGATGTRSASTLLIGLALFGVFLAPLPDGLQRRLGFAVGIALLLSVSTAGCGGSSGSSGPTSSTQTVTAASVSNSSGPVTTSGLPASLGKITVG